MAVAEEERTDSQQEEGAGRSAALKAAGAAAATGAAAFAVQKVLEQRSKGESQPKRKERKADGQGSLFASAAAGGWDAARDSYRTIRSDSCSSTFNVIMHIWRHGVRPKLCSSLPAHSWALPLGHWRRPRTPSRWFSTARSCCSRHVGR